MVRRKRGRETKSKSGQAKKDPKLILNRNPEEREAQNGEK